MIYLTRRAFFCAGHRLHNPAFSDEENDRIFGLCNNPNFHGHNYTLEVTIAGEPDPQTGMVMDLKDLKALIDREIIERVDHKNLNLDVDFLNGIIPSAENIVHAFWVILKPKITNGKLFSIRLFESENNIVEYRGA
jgi:6-pyruvoyltetrahydropterin/6-carboxytetrahydropterin synthase